MNGHSPDGGRAPLARARMSLTAAPAQPLATPRPRALQALLGRVLPWADAALALLLFLVTVQLRRPYKMRLPYAWDSLLFVRAVDHFNATIHQPQPPGYFFYVSTARLLNLVIGDPHRSLVWISALASGVAVAALYLVTRLLYDRPTGLVAAGLLMTSVTFWFYGEIAYPYTTLAAGSTVLALIALGVRRGLLPGVRGAALAGLAYALILGFRQDLVLFMAPLFAAAFWGRPLHHWLAAAGAGALGVLAWLLPTAALSEGLVKYLEATSRQGGSASGASSVFAGGLEALRFNVREVTTFLWRGLYFALAPLIYFVLRAPLSLLQWRRAANRRGRAVFPALPWVLLWLAPPLTFYVLAHIGDYGYTFSVLPALLVLAARGVVLGARDAVAVAARGAALMRLPGGIWGDARLRRVGAVLLALLLGAAPVAANGRFFLARHAQFSVRGITCFDETMHERLRVVRAHFRPGETLIFSGGYYQHVRYFLPEYQAWLYDPAAGARVERAIGPETRYLVVFDEVTRPDGQSGDFDRATLPCNGAPFYSAAVREGDIVRYDAGALTIAVERR